MGETRLPHVRREIDHVLNGIGADPLQHIDQVRVDVGAVQPARGDQTLNDATCLALISVQQKSQLRTPQGIGRRARALLPSRLRQINAIREIHVQGFELAGFCRYTRRTPSSVIAP